MDLGRLLAGKRAALFDFDGVLVDSEPFHHRAYDAAFRRFGHTLDPDEYRVHWTSRGEGIPGEIDRHGLRGIDPTAIKRLKDEVYSELCDSGQVRFFPGAIDAMQRLEERGVKVAIASNSIRENIEGLFAVNGIDYRPRFIVGWTVGLRPKPAPDIFARALETIVEEAADCVVFEDAEKGVAAARGVDLPCVVIRNHLNRDISFAGADLVIQSIEEIE